MKFTMRMYWPREFCEVTLLIFAVLSNLRFFFLNRKSGRWSIHVLSKRQFVIECLY